MPPPYYCHWRHERFKIRGGSGGPAMRATIGRRTFLSAGAAAFAAARVLSIREAFAQAVPNSSGTQPATLKAPPGACDCHHHIYDAIAFAPVSPQSRMQMNAS